MSDGLKKYINATLGFMVIGVAVWAIYALGVFVITKFAGLNPNVAAALVAAVATVAVSIATAVISKGLESKAATKKEQRGKKVPAYESMVKIMFDFIESRKSGADEMDEKAIYKEMVEFTKKLMVWGSDDVVSAWAKFRTDAGKQSHQQEPQSLINLENVILAMRKDLGHKDKNLKRNDVLKLFVNDLD